MKIEKVPNAPQIKKDTSSAALSSYISEIEKPAKNPDKKDLCKSKERGKQ